MTLRLLIDKEERKNVFSTYLLPTCKLLVLSTTVLGVKFLALYYCVWGQGEQGKITLPVGVYMIMVEF